MTPSPVHSSRSGRVAPALGILAEDLNGALAAASRLQQRGLTVEIVSPRDRHNGQAQAVILDLDLTDVSADADQAREKAYSGATWLADVGCRAIEQRFDSLLRGSPSAVFAGMHDACAVPGTIVVAVPAYPSAGRLCVDGRIVSFDADANPLEIDVSGMIGTDPVAVVDVTTLTEGAQSVVAAFDRALERGVTRFVLDGTVEGHLRVANAAVETLLARDHHVLTVSSGAWLRYFPDLDSDGFVVIAAPARDAMDRRQLQTVGDVYGQAAVFLSLAEVLESTDKHLEELTATHRFLVLQGSDEDGAPADIAASFGRAVRRLLDIGNLGRHRCLGVIASGGLTSSSVIRALDPESLRPGNELEPLSPVVRLVGGPFPNVPVICKASGIGSIEMMVRLVRRIIGT